MSAVIKEIQEWFVEQCDGAWEHQYGLKIETLDNPGWFLEIDLQGTGLETRSFKEVDISRDEDDWIRCRLNGKRFEGFSGPRNLQDLLEIFVQWAKE